MDFTKTLAENKGMFDNTTTWEFVDGIIVSFDETEEFKEFEVYFDGKLLGTIVPCDEDMLQSLIGDFDSGHNPVTESWEDGRGNTCSMEGWGQ